MFRVPQIALVTNTPLQRVRECMEESVEDEPQQDAHRAKHGDTRNGEHDKRDERCGGQQWHAPLFYSFGGSVNGYRHV